MEEIIKVGESREVEEQEDFFAKAYREIIEAITIFEAEEDTNVK